MTPELRQIKRATERLCNSLGRYEAAAAIIGKGKSTVHRWADHRNPDNADIFINLPDLCELEANAPEPLVTMTLCRLNGGVFVPLPDSAADPETLAGMVMQLSGRLGDLSREMATALADGTVTPAEARRLIDLQADLDGTSAQLRQALMAMAEGGR